MPSNHESPPRAGHGPIPTNGDLPRNPLSTDVSTAGIVVVVKEKT